MAILPVMDLKDGQVVRAVRGQRAAYRPVTSTFSSEPSPSSVAKGLVEYFGFDLVYVADLDAIEGREPNWQGLQQISDSGLRVWIDMGLGSLARTREVCRFCDEHVSLGAIIIALESIDHPDSLAGFTSQVQDLDRYVFSIDLRDGAPLNQSPSWQGMSPRKIADLAVSVGFQRLIVLDLASVGSGEGPSVEILCRQIRAAHPHGQLTSGGGVRDASDVRRLESAGCDYVLVASALHDGRIDRDSI